MVKKHVRGKADLFNQSISLEIVDNITINLNNNTPTIADNQSMHFVV